MSHVHASAPSATAVPSCPILQFSWPQSVKLRTEFKLPCLFANMKPVQFSVPTSELIFLEIFAGSAPLSAAMRSTGLQVMAVDKSRARQTSAAIMLLDITKPCDQDVLIDVVCHANIGAAHFRCPSDTVVSSDKDGLDFRSSSNLFGLPSLTSSDRFRVEVANQLYAFVLVLLTILHARGVLLSLDNPSASFLWSIFESLVRQCMNEHAVKAWQSLEANNFQMCMFGPSDNRWTQWRGTREVFQPLRKSCSGQHAHTPAAPEAACPLLLCHNVTQCVQVALQSRGTLFDQDTITNSQLPAKAFQNPTIKVRGKPLLSEYWLITNRQCAMRFFPHASPLKAPPLPVKSGGMKEESCETCASQPPTDLEKQAAVQPWTTWWPKCKPGEDLYGVHRTPEQAWEAAHRIPHPLSMAFAGEITLPLPDVMVEALFWNLSHAPAEIAEWRAEQAARILSMRQELQAQEAELHETLDPTLKVLLQGKQLKLWEQLAKEAKCPDLDLFEEVKGGFNLVGPGRYSELFPHGAQPALMTPEELRKQSVWRRKATIAKCKPHASSEMDEVLWAQTLAERDAGWITGPFLTEDEVSHEVGNFEWIATRRFPLLQKSKVRIIDDGLDSGLNSAYSSYNKLKLLDSDSLITMILALLRCSAATDGFCFALTNGTRLAGKPHPFWVANPSLCGATIDLKSAYKQLGARPEDKWCRVLVAYSPVHQQPVFFLGNALPFGSASSVYCFNRCSRSIWWLATKLGSLTLGCYYDDYPIVDFAPLSKSAFSFMSLLLKALGWQYAETGDKAQSMAPMFDVLGVRVDLTRSQFREVVVANKPERIDSLLSELSQILDDKKLTPSRASSLQGKLNFAQGQFLGNSLKPAMHF